MKVQQNIKSLVFSEDAAEVRVAYANRGEPFKEGVELSFIPAYYNTSLVRVLLDIREVKHLRDKLNEFLGEEQ